MKKVIFSIFLLLVFNPTTFSQTLTQNIRGRVIDADSGEPLEFVSPDYLSKIDE